MLIRLLSSLCAILLIGSAVSAAPKTYVFTGKLTSNRGTLMNVPMVGNTPCSGAGLANLTVMWGPIGKQIPSPYDPPPLRTANANEHGCAAHVPGKKITTTGAGAGGGFVMPTGVFSQPLRGTAIAIPNATPIKQIFTSFKVTGPRASPTGGAGSMARSFPPAAQRAFKKGAWMTQTGRVGEAFTWCWGAPDCAKITQGSKPLIVKYRGGSGNAFGGTMGYVITSGANPSNIGVAVAGGGPIGFGIMPTTGSQPTGRGYAGLNTDMGPQGPLWGMYQASKNGRVTMVSLYVGMSFPKVYRYNFGFPWTTMTVLARNTGTFAGNPQTATLTAKGGDSVTAMGKRNISLVAGGVAQTTIGALNLHTPEIGQMYLPEPGGAGSLLAGALGLLGVAASRRRR